MFGETVRAYRRRQGLSQEELAEAASLSVRGIRKIEAGDTGAPRPATLRLLANALKLTGSERDRFLGAVAGESAARHATVPRQLPADVYRFTGRAAQLHQLDAMLPGGADRTPTVVISAIGGTAGVGKTALAVHWAHRVADRFPDGQLYVNLRGFDPSDHVMPPAEAVRHFLDALGVPAERVPADPHAQVGLYRSLLADKRVMVLLDNARDADQVRPLLPGSSTVAVVVTSRNQLTPLVAAQGARPVNLDLLSTEEARGMLAGRLGAERVAAEPDATDVIIDACARLPLALTIAAARAVQTGFPLATLAAELQDAGKRLDTLDAGDPVSQVRAVFSWSYAVLTPPGARLFRLLGLHPGPDASAAAAASLAGCPADEARRLLAELVRASLLTEHAPGRYTFHDLLRAYATERAEADEGEAGRRLALTRLLDHHTHIAHAADRLLHPKREPPVIPLAQPCPGTTVEQPTDYPQAMDWLNTEHRVLITTLRHAAATGFDVNACQLAWSLDTFLNRLSYWRDHATAWQTALDCAHRLSNAAIQICAHRRLATALINLRRYDDARHHLVSGLDLATQLGDLAAQGHTHRVLGFLHERLSEPRPALGHIQQALILLRAADDQPGVARVLNSLGWCHALLGDYEQAVAFCEQALAALQQLGDQHGRGAAWHSLGYAHNRLGRHAEAADCYRRAIALNRQLGDAYHLAVSLAGLGENHQAAGDPAAAKVVWRQALDIFTELDHPDAEDLRSKLNSLKS